MKLYDINGKDIGLIISEVFLILDINWAIILF